MMEGIEQFIGLGTLVWYPKNYILLKEGQFSSKIWVMKKGIARYIYYKESKEITGWIDLEGDIVGSVFSTVGLGPARETIQLVEDSELHEIPIEPIRKDPALFAEFKNQVLLHYFIELENRVKFFQSLSGKERYAHLLAHRPDLLLRVPLHLLSSYLGLTPESLSRIRGSIS